MTNATVNGVPVSGGFFGEGNLPAKGDTRWWFFFSTASSVLDSADTFTVEMDGRCFPAKLAQLIIPEDGKGVRQGELRCRGPFPFTRDEWRAREAKHRADADAAISSTPNVVPTSI